MSNNIFYIRTTKFPYFFWSFNKNCKCLVDFENNRYQNLELTNNCSYNIKPFNFLFFLFLKYFFIFVVFYFVFNKYDFYLNTRNIICYCLALVLILSVNFLDNLSRKILILIIFIMAIFLSFFTNDFFLFAYMLKYFIFLSVLLLIYIDFNFRIYSIYDDRKKILAHFLIKKRKRQI
ncbi:hypothetical protein EWV09_08125 [Campylobacter lari]|nr:hypothetical protein [Campylobacter lari]